ncbi:MAG: M24 family metallopeptidase [Streptosporangiales bacterium]|nr:M24 family metallopeptidase [Streptosporangiales bacterium]
MSETHVVRRRRLAGSLVERGVAALLVTRPVNVRYLTGLDSSNAAVLAYPDRPAVIATDSRYAEAAAALEPAIEVITARPVARALAERATADGVGAVGFEAHDMSVAAYNDLVAAPRTAGLEPAGALVEELRVHKDEAEIAALREACAITDRAFADVLPRIRAGITEREIARALEVRMVELGADAPGFGSVVASGENGSVPHHTPGDRAVEAGDLVTMDFGARYDGYHADMTRTVAIGRAAEWQRELYELVATAQAAGRASALPGADVLKVDGAARAVIARGGHGDAFTHGLGHGVGLEIHEAPMLGPGRTGTLTEGVPITVEPGVYLPGRGGVRIEDTLVVRAGAPDLLTQTPRDLFVL